MKNKATFIANIKARVSFILTEIGKIPISQATKSEILDICEKITGSVLADADKKDDVELLAQLRVQLARFDDLISSMIGNKQEMAVYMLLTNQQAEILELVSQEENS